MAERKTSLRVVILGGYGVFGGKLASLLLRNPRYEVIVAGRDLKKAQAFCKQHGGTPVVLDRNTAEFSERLAMIEPFVTVDAAGPFQDYCGNTYGVVKAALNTGSHYLDLSDDARFTREISSLDFEAHAAGLVVLSGVSSVPALSSAAVEDLKTSFSRLDVIESVILPGNRAPRGLSVIRAILAQVGKPISVTRAGKPDKVVGWSGLKRQTIDHAGQEGLKPRWSCFIGAPDLTLFPKHYGAKTVLFRAGLELSFLHLGLWLLGCFVRLKLIRSLEPAARPMKIVADWLENFGSDRGGMEVSLAGLDNDGAPVKRAWTLIAEAGDGPYIPAVAAAVLCERLAEQAVRPGARPCLGEFSTGEFDRATAHLSVATFKSKENAPTLFQQALGSDFKGLPEAVRSLHTVFDRHSWSGLAKVTRGRSKIGNLICRIVGLPPPAESCPVSVIIERKGKSEVWSRQFGAHKMRSKLSLAGKYGSGIICEQFGLLGFHIHLHPVKGRLNYPVKRGTFLGLPLPKWTLPVSETTEFELGGKFHFDVKISQPGLGLLVHYQGWLEEDVVNTQALSASADQMSPT
ncbi:Saccharopine dehydrogenase [Roseibium album]|nr:Saccharopine dehydrogenase [Roseibium album]